MKYTNKIVVKKTMNPRKKSTQNASKMTLSLDNKLQQLTCTTKEAEGFR